MQLAMKPLRATSGAAATLTIATLATTNPAVVGAPKTTSASMHRTPSALLDTLAPTVITNTAILAMMTTTVCGAKTAPAAKSREQVALPAIPAKAIAKDIPLAATATISLAVDGVLVVEMVFAWMSITHLA